jgi:hypothetical protein
MAECEEESQTQHYLGEGNGYGPIKDAELVYLAVFEQTLRDGSRLTANSFDNKQLKKDGQSVCRADSTTRATFLDQVVRAGVNAKGALAGVASASASSIRSLQAKVLFAGAEESVRSFCVLDHVLPGDYDSHATIKYGEKTARPQMSEQYISKIRSKVRLDLADAFSDIKPDHEVRFQGD